jgi:predicted RNA-binding protein with PUA domain
LQERINAANAPFLGYREVLAKVSSDDRYNVKLVSVSLGAKEAVATLRYKDQWTVVQEGGRVFGIGTLKLVRPGSIVIGTAHGDMTYGL